MVISEDKMAEIELRFQALWEYKKKIEAFKEEIKMVTSSMTDTYKSLLETLETEPAPLKKAVKEWFEQKENKELYDEKEEILALIFERVEKK